jgi:hypothetical protein
VKSEHMSRSNASLLVAGGAITVLLLPMTAALLEPQRREPAMDGSATRLVNVPIDEIAPTGLEPALPPKEGDGEQAFATTVQPRDRDGVAFLSS